MSNPIREALEILNEPREKTKPKPDCKNCKGSGEHKCHWAGHVGHVDGHITRCGCIPFIGDGRRIDELEDKVERAIAALRASGSQPDASVPEAPFNSADRLLARDLLESDDPEAGVAQLISDRERWMHRFMQATE